MHTPQYSAENWMTSREAFLQADDDVDSKEEGDAVNQDQEAPEGYKDEQNRAADQEEGEKIYPNGTSLHENQDDVVKAVEE